MKTLRTPDERFADLPDYPFTPRYTEVPDGDGGTLRVHYLDERPIDVDPFEPDQSDPSPILLMHGEPSWSYLYRTMIPILVAAGHRVVAPDLVGFGRSDKPTETSDYTYARHVAWMEALLIDHLDLRGATFFGQDWGGLVGLRVVTANPDRFDRIVVGNTGLPTGDGKASEAFMAWQKFSQETPVFDIGSLINRATVTELSDAEIAAYDAPFPDDSYKAGARIFPTLVPTRPDDPAAADNRAAWDVLEAWDKPLITCFSDSDPVTAGGERMFQQRVPGAAGQPHVTIERAAHFFQEDAAEQLAQVLIDAIAR